MTSKANFLTVILLAVLGINLCRAIWLRPANQYVGSDESVSTDKQILIGTVKSEPLKSGYRSSFFVLPNGKKQMIQVSEYKAIGVGYGDVVLLAGKLKLPKSTPGAFDYSDYLQAQNIFVQADNPEIYALSGPRGFGSALVRAVLDFKGRMYSKIINGLGSSKGGLQVALMFGDKSKMQKSDQANFNNIGAAHMIAVSGFKLTLLLIWLDLLRRWISKRWLLLISVLIIFCYLAFSGFAAAVLRAAIMNSVYVFAKYKGRKYSTLPILLMTAALLTSFNPLIMLFDIGFLLSFGGILGIIIFGPLLAKILHKIKWRRLHYLKGIFISGFAAQLATAPLIALFFQQFNPYGPLVNLFFVPFLIPSILSGYLSLLPVLGFAARFVSQIILAILLWFAGFCAKLPGASIAVQITWQLAIALYILEGVILFLIYAFRRHNGELKNRGEFDKIKS